MQAGISSEVRTLAAAGHDNINRRVETFLRGLSASYKGLPAKKAELAIQERDIAMMQERANTLREEIKLLEAIELNTAARHDIEGYDGRISGVVEDIRGDPSLMEFLVDRSKIIARDFNVKPEAIEQDIREGLA